MTVLKRTIEALRHLGGKGSYSEIYREYEKDSWKTNYRWSRSWN